MATKLHQAIRKTEGATTRTAVQITRPRTSMYQRQGNRNFTGNRFALNYVYSWEPETFYPAWKEITSDPVILNIINESLHINFKNDIPGKGPFEHKHSQRDSDIISEEIKKLLQK